MIISENFLEHKCIWKALDSGFKQFGSDVCVCLHIKKTEFLSNENPNVQTSENW